jgi:hypothetical protein
MESFRFNWYESTGAEKDELTAEDLAVKSEYESRQTNMQKIRKEGETLRATINIILALNSGLYDEKNVEGQDVVVGRGYGNGFRIRTKTAEGLYLVSVYDEDGCMESQTTEKEEN